MLVKINKNFLKDLARIPIKDRLKIETFVFEESVKITSFASPKKFEKLKGYKSYYRIRFGKYRVGVKFEKGILYFERVLHRRDIYNYFP